MNVGIIGHDRVSVSIVMSHFINGLIKENKMLSINIVNEGILPQADYSGSVSVAKTDKSSLFEYEIGDAGTPVIKKMPLVMECEVIDEYHSLGFESFICTISNSYVEEEHLDEAGKINYHTLKLVPLEFPTYEYLKTSEIIGKCLSFGDGKAYKDVRTKGIRGTDISTKIRNYNGLCGTV